LLVGFSQLIQRVVGSDHVHAAALERQPIQRQAIASIPLGGIAVPCIIDQPHQLGTDGQEMSAVFELGRALFSGRK
jgi:hypothetical protein